MGILLGLVTLFPLLLFLGEAELPLLLTTTNVSVELRLISSRSHLLASEPRRIFSASCRSKSCSGMKCCCLVGLKAALLVLLAGEDRSGETALGILLTREMGEGICEAAVGD